MHKLKYFFVLLLLVCFIAVIYRNFLGNKLFFGGDFYFPAKASGIFQNDNRISVWNPATAAGLGINRIQTLPYDIYSQILPQKALSAGISPVLIQKLFFILPYFFISYLSSLYFCSVLFRGNQTVKIIAPLIYMTNSYILMIVSGGQLGIALAYASVPAVIAHLIHLTGTVKNNPLK